MVMAEKSEVFEQTYRAYLTEIASLDYLSRAEFLGAGIDGDDLIIPLYDRTYAVSPERIVRVDGGASTDAVRVILARYVLGCPQEPVDRPDEWVTYREFKDGAPLVSYFTTNTNKTLETQFSGRVELLRERGARLGGTVGSNDSYDLSLTFSCLPRVPVMLNFNDADDMFPAGCSVLYRKSAQHYLDMECLAMTGTLLTGELLKPAS